MEPPSSPFVSVLNQSGYSIDTEPIEAAVATTLSAKGFPASEVSILLTDDGEVQRLNRSFRGIDEPTDVLTFVSDDLGSGDIAIAVPYAEKQSHRRGVPLEQELSYLAIHGALHLAGLDDESDEDRHRMIAEMNATARSLGLPEDHDWGSLLHSETDL